MIKKRIYLDNSATTPISKDVVKEMQKYFSESYGNASSLHYFGRQAKQAVESSRAKIAKLINAEIDEIIFTSCGTESNNLAILGVAKAYGDYGHIITSPIEHYSVLSPCNYLKNRNYQITYIDVNQSGIVSPTDLINSLQENTILISIMHANNEIGVIQPIEDIASKLYKINQTRKQKVYLHTDAIQTAGKLNINVKNLGIDLLSISAHKLHGPKGIGALYVKRGIKIFPILFGGHHEKNLRPGTENVLGIVGLSKSYEIAYNSLKDHYSHVLNLKRRLEEGILNDISDVTINTDKTNSLPHILNVSFKYIEGESLLLMLDMYGIAVSTGSACTSDSLNPSHVLTSIGLNTIAARGSIRFSLSYQNTLKEIDYVLSVLPKIVNDLRLMSPMWKKHTVY
ncbi:MAG: cysteine desulfurase [Endomicrobium sp.]|jgi:cysteine desulfurase|nr:cysteine desulfurase [Endomicrobium sp.]